LVQRPDLSTVITGSKNRPPGTSIDPAQVATTLLRRLAEDPGKQRTVNDRGSRLLNLINAEGINAKLTAFVPPEPGQLINRSCPRDRLVSPRPKQLIARAVATL
jgi:hypothetical protein